MTTITAPRPRKSHRPAPCPVTGKLRYRERKDAGLALRDAKYLRSALAVSGIETSWTIVRAYKCEACSGWHTTSRPALPTFTN